MKVPPPYIPPLSGSGLALAGPAGYAFAPSIEKPRIEIKAQPRLVTQDEPITGDSTIKPAPRKSPKPFTLPSWTALNIRERILLGLLLFSLVLVPSSLPPTSVDARQYNPSNSDLEAVERPEENFAGSAFYFIDPGYAIPQNYGDLAIDPLAEPGSGFDLLQNPSGDPLKDGPLAANRDQAYSANLIQPVSFKASLIDNNRALQCLTSAIYYEAGMEPDAGQRAVAQVILNRVRHPSYPGTVCGVIFQGSERRTGCQFSYTCDGSLRRKPSKFAWDRARKVAAYALSGQMASPVGTATHYHATYVYPYWAPSLRFLGTIGLHRFYSWKGNAGKASAFRQRYVGGEPLPAPKPRAYTPEPAASLDPISLEKAYENGFRKAQEEAAKSEKQAAVAADNARRHNQSAPSLAVGAPKTYQMPSYSKEATQKGGEKAFAGQKLPDVSQIKPEYRDAGSWKKRPGS